MKKITLASALFTALLGLTLTGCLKDKGFDNYEYGINDPDTQPPGVGFPKAANKKNTVGLDVSGSNQAVNDVVYVNLESGSPAAADVQVTIQIDNSLVTAYNTANGTNIQILSSTLYSLPSLTLTIPAGQRNVQIPINVSSTLALDPNSSYGVGIKIASVTGNYVVASNLRDLLIEFTIKNKYDGKYQLRGYHNRPGLSNPYDETVDMVTSGPASVYMYWPALGAAAHPLNGGVTYYGSFTSNFYFNPTTNQITAWDWTPYATTLPVSMGPATDSRYVPASGGNPAMIYANFYYNNNPGARAFFDTLTHLGPR